MASASIPFAYPPRWIEDAYYCDGSMRFNTPIAPAIRAGADKLLIISLLKNKKQTEIEQDAAEQPPFPGMLMLAGKVLNALLADPLNYDLQVLRRFNRLLEVLDEALTEKEMDRVDQSMVELRGKSYRKIEPLVFSPTEDIGRMAGLHLRLHRSELDLNRFGAWLLGRASKDQATWEADLASYFLYDGSFAAKLIDLGRRDALSREEDIRAFFKT
jgi:NTE family protein